MCVFVIPTRSTLKISAMLTQSQSRYSASCEVTVKVNPHTLFAQLKLLAS